MKKLLLVVLLIIVVCSVAQGAPVSQKTVYTAITADLLEEIGEEAGISVTDKLSVGDIHTIGISAITKEGLKITAPVVVQPVNLLGHKKYLLSGVTAVQVTVNILEQLNEFNRSNALVVVALHPELRRAFLRYSVDVSGGMTREAIKNFLVTFRDTMIFWDKWVKDAQF